MEVGRGLVYPCQTMLDDVEIDVSSYVVIKVTSFSHALDFFGTPMFRFPCRTVRLVLNSVYSDSAPTSPLGFQNESQWKVLCWNIRVSKKLKRNFLTKRI
jgi:hypothetical protein